MTKDRFEEVAKEQLNRIEEVLIKKQKEYGPKEDKLTVFKKAAQFMGTNPEQALYGFMAKHLVSQSDMIKSGEKYAKEVWLEKITDIINYNILLLALLEDDNMYS